MKVLNYTTIILIALLAACKPSQKERDTDKHMSMYELVGNEELFYGQEISFSGYLDSGVVSKNPLIYLNKISKDNLQFHDAIMISGEEFRQLLPEECNNTYVIITGTLVHFEAPDMRDSLLRNIKRLVSLKDQKCNYDNDYSSNYGSND